MRRPVYRAQGAALRAQNLAVDFKNPGNPALKDDGATEPLRPVRCALYAAPCMALYAAPCALYLGSQ
jgi:hypothetical protein